MPDDLTDMFKWKVTNVSGDTYTIVNEANDLSSYVGSDVYPPAHLIVAPPPTTQQWRIIPVPDTTNVYTIATIDNNMYWSLNSTESGANVILSKTGGGRLQHWRIEVPGAFLPSGNYKLRNVLVDLPIKANGEAVDEMVVTAKDDYSDDFKWTVTNISKNMYTITNARTGYCLQPDLEMRGSVKVGKTNRFVQIIPVDDKGPRDRWKIRLFLNGSDKRFLSVHSWMPNAVAVASENADAVTLDEEGDPEECLHWVIKKA
jgi:hypothetical protein